jgi:hypothetical protein
VRTAFFILVLANLAFFAWSRYLAPSQAAADGVVARRHNPEELKIVPPAPANPAP